LAGWEDDPVPHHAIRDSEQMQALHPGGVQRRVTDHGAGLDLAVDGPEQRGRGLANMAGRAASLGGSMTLPAGQEGGAELVWKVPLEPR
jgi:signal transduction histidine kinase